MKLLVTRLMTVLMAGLLWPAGALATLIDLTPGAGSSGMINGALFEFSVTQPTGTGVFQPFVRIQSNGVEEGYNTSGRALPFDEMNPLNFTHDLQLSDLGVTSIGGIDYVGFVLDINESNAGNESTISLDEIRIYTSSSGSLNSTDLDSLGTLRYDLDQGEDSYILLDHDNAEGSGKSDMSAYIPLSLFEGASPDDFLYFYSKFGLNAASDAGFEEWSTISGTPIPEPSTALLLGLGLLGLHVSGRRR